MAKQRKRKIGAGDVATNRQASFRYHLLEKLECGIALTGTEVKSLREGKAQIKDGYAAVSDGELWLHNVHIPPYQPAARDNHEPERARKLLVHRRELERLIGKVRERGLTLVPTRIYFSRAPRQGRDGAGARQGAPTTSARRSASASRSARSTGPCATPGAERAARPAWARRSKPGADEDAQQGLDAARAELRARAALQLAHGRLPATSRAGRAGRWSSRRTRRIRT